MFCTYIFVGDTKLSSCQQHQKLFQTVWLEFLKQKVWAYNMYFEHISQHLLHMCRAVLFLMQGSVTIANTWSVNQINRKSIYLSLSVSVCLAFSTLTLLVGWRLGMLLPVKTYVHSFFMLWCWWLGGRQGISLVKDSLQCPLLSRGHPAKPGSPGIGRYNGVCVISLFACSQCFDAVCWCHE